MALVTTCMSACTGFLDIEPETTLTGKNFYKSPDDIRSALYSTYSSLRDNGLYSASIYLFGDVRSDVAFPNQTNYYANTFRHEIEKFTISANNSGNQNYWAHHYKGIIRANTVIEKGKELFGNDEAVQKYIAEAEVLRALFYFNLVRAYGGVPIIMDIPQEYTDSRGHLRASTEEVYIRILTDLTTAIESNNLYRSTNSNRKSQQICGRGFTGKSTSIHAERHHRSCLSQRRSMERYICQSKHYRILSGNDHYAIRSRQVLSRRCDKQWRIRIVPEFQ